MELHTDPAQLRDYLRTMRMMGKTIGLVPTMGALHAGHLSLMRQAKACDIVVASIFVNPLQFNKAEDLDNYPRDLPGDLQQLEGFCDVVFSPSAEVMYPSAPLTAFSFGEIEMSLEGEFRPGHFAGVGLVVSKLFNIVQPDKAYFGLKDLQQYLIIRQMAQDLSMPLEIVGCPIVREPSGLAMSSRNRRLTEQGKNTAAKIYQGLQLARQTFDRTESIHETKNTVMEFYNSVIGMQIEYFELVNDKMKKLNTSEDEAIIACVAAHVEGVRLIDNLYLRSE